MDDYLDCDLCFESFTCLRVPKILISCGHTICSTCLQKMVINKRIICPNCKQVTMLLSSNVNDLPTNFQVRKMAEQKLGKQRNVLCKDHAKKLERFCEDPKCMRGICKDCTAHKGHPNKRIDEAATFYRQKLSEKLRSVKGVVEKVDLESQNLEKSINAFQKEKLMLEENVKFTFNQIKEWASKREESLLGEINTRSLLVQSSLFSKRAHFIEVKKPILDIEKLLNEKNSPTTNYTPQLTLLENVSGYFQQIDQMVHLNLDTESNKSSNLLELKGLEEKDAVQNLIANLGNFVERESNQQSTQPEKNNKASIQKLPSIPSIPSSIIPTPTPTPLQQQPQNFEKSEKTPEDFSRDYTQILPRGNQTCKRVYGPKLDGGEKLDRPSFVKIISKDLLSSDNNSNSSDQKQPSDDLLVVTDSASHKIILIEKTSGKVQSTIGGKQGVKLGELSQPQSVAIIKNSSHPNLILLVADYDNNRIQSFDIKTGKYLNHFTHAKYIKRPTGISVNPQNDQIVIANFGSNCITIHNGYQISNNNNNNNNFGGLVKVIGDNDGIKLDYPRDVAINSKGHIIVSSRHKIDIIDGNDFKHLKSFGSKGVNESEFTIPQGVCVDPLDNILVCDAGNYRVQLFDKDGKFIGVFGKEGNDQTTFGGLGGIAVDYSTNDIYIVDWGNNRLLVF